MDIIEISPPKHINFSIPQDLHRKITITNLTLRSLYISLLSSHPYELTVDSNIFLCLEPFQQIKIDIYLNWNQEGLNLSSGKLRIYYWQIEGEQQKQQLIKYFMQNTDKIMFEDISIQLRLNSKILKFKNYQFTQECDSLKCIQNIVSKKYFIIQCLYPLIKQQKQIVALQSDILKNKILNLLQSLQYVKSIQPSNSNKIYIMEVQQDKEDICQFYIFQSNDIHYIYVIRRIVSYGQPYIWPTLVNIQDQIKEITSPMKNKISNQSNQQKISKQIIKNEQKINLTNSISQNTRQQVKQKQIKNQEKNKINMTRQSFVMKIDKQRGKYKRKNKSQQKIVQISSQQQQITQQLKNIRKMQLNISNIKIKQPEIVKIQAQPNLIKIKKQIKTKQTNIQMNQKVLNMIVENDNTNTYVIVLLRDCLHYFIIQKPSFKKIIKFQAIYQENINMPCPMELYKNQVIFANQSCLFWINIQTQQSDWKYVQRKQIYSLAVIQQLSLVAVGGKNFSKFSYFGKQTSRSNIKMYSCSLSDKNDHLFTYDLPGNNVGNVTNMVYITTPPNGSKILLAQTVNNELKSMFFFLSVKAFNKIEVYGQIQLDELGILNLMKIKYNKNSHRLVCMEALGQSQFNNFKKLKLRCQYQKVEVSTEGFKFKLGKFEGYNLGGSKNGKQREWLSWTDYKQSSFHIYDFETNITKDFDWTKPDIKHVFTVQNGKYLVVCSSTTICIHEQYQIEIKQN